MKLILSICAVLICVSAANAQCGSNIVSFPNTYQYPVKQVIVPVQVSPVVTPVIPLAVPVLIPAFQFQYQAPCATATQAVTATPAVPVGNPAMPAATQKDDLRSLIKSVLQEMKDGDDGPPMALIDDQPTKGVQPQTRDYVSMLQTRCAACHTGSRASGGVKIFLDGGAFNVAIDKSRLARAIEERRMPKDPATMQYSPLPPEDVALSRKELH